MARRTRLGGILVSRSTAQRQREHSAAQTERSSGAVRSPLRVATVTRTRTASDTLRAAARRGARHMRLCVRMDTDHASPLRAVEMKLSGTAPLLTAGRLGWADGAADHCQRRPDATRVSLSAHRCRRAIGRHGRCLSLVIAGVSVPLLLTNAFEWRLNPPHCPL